jgi:outer membrane immunogenic protein
MTEAPAAAQGYNWNGAYVGIGAGSGAVVHNLNVIGIDILDGIGGEGMFGEVIAGYDHMISDRMLVGAFASYRMGNIATTLDVNTPGPSFNYEVTMDHGYDLGARLGFLIAPYSLAYLTGGYTHQNFSADGSFGLSYDWDQDGYFAGAGIETALFGNWTAKAEYRFSQFSKQDIIPGFVSIEPSVHTFHAGLNYRFGGGMTAGATTFAPINYDFSGLKLSVAGGMGAVVHQLDLDLAPFIPVTASFNGIGGEGMFGEVGAVYDVALASNWVAGVGADYRSGNIKTDLDLSIFGNASVTLDHGYDLYARLGYQAMPGTLVYGLAGMSWQHFAIDANSAILPPALLNAIEDASWSSHGYTVGGGIETAISDKWTAKIEYRFAEYDAEDFDTNGIIEISPSTHTVRAGLTYKLF